MSVAPNPATCPFHSPGFMSGSRTIRNAPALVPRNALVTTDRIRLGPLAIGSYSGWWRNIAITQATLPSA